GRRSRGNGVRCPVRRHRRCHRCLGGTSGRRTAAAAYGGSSTRVGGEQVLGAGQRGRLCPPLEGDGIPMTEPEFSIAHLTTVDLSLRYLVLPQLEAPLSLGIGSIGISAPGPWVEDLKARGIQHIPLQSSTRGMSLISDLRAAWELAQALRRVRPDVLHTHNPKPGLSGRVIGRLLGVPIVVNPVHGIYAVPDDRLLKRAVVYLLEAVAAWSSDVELVESAEDTALMRRLRIAPRGRVEHLGYCVDLDRFDRRRLGPEVRRELMSELGVGPDAIVVGCVGRLVLEK